MGKFSKDNAYFSALVAVVICLQSLFYFILSLFKIEFTIKWMGKSKGLDYIIMGLLLLPICIGVYFLFPPKKVKLLYRNFKNDRTKNIIIITAIILICIFTFIIRIATVERYY
jgi:hypothetical protein